MIPMLPSLLGLAAAEGQNETSLFFSFAARVLPSGVTFSNASSCRYYCGSDGTLFSANEDEPRFDYDPSSGEYLGLLYEEQRTNLAYPSDGSGWVVRDAGEGSEIEISNYMNLLGEAAYNLKEGSDTTNSTFHDIETKTKIGNLGSVVCISTFFKKDVGSYVGLRQSDLHATIFNLDEQEASYSNDTPLSTGAQSFSDGWLRCHRSGLEDYNAVYDVSLADSAIPSLQYGIPDYVADGTRSVALSFLQIEVGAKPSSPIITTSATATRAADQLSFDIPDNINTLRLTLGDNTTQDIAVTAGTSNYVLDPSILNEPHIKLIQGVTV